MELFGGLDSSSDFRFSIQAQALRIEFRLRLGDFEPMNNIIYLIYCITDILYCTPKSMFTLLLGKSRKCYEFIWICQLITSSQWLYNVTVQQYLMDWSILRSLRSKSKLYFSLKVKLNCQNILALL